MPRISRGAGHLLLPVLISQAADTCAAQLALSVTQTCSAQLLSAEELIASMREEEHAAHLSARPQKACACAVGQSDDVSGQGMPGDSVSCCQHNHKTACGLDKMTRSQTGTLRCCVDLSATAQRAFF